MYTNQPSEGGGRRRVAPALSSWEKANRRNYVLFHDRTEKVFEWKGSRIREVHINQPIM